MTIETSISKPDTLFRAISAKKVRKSDLNKLIEYSDRNQCIRFFVGKLNAFQEMAETEDSWDTTSEDGCIRACRVLGALKAEAAIEILIRILDSVKSNVDFIIFSATGNALSDIGPPVLEPVYAKYEEDKDNPGHAATWLDILSRIGVHDPRITKATQKSFSFNTTLGLIFIGTYGDREFLPLVDRYVQSAGT